MRHAVPRRAIAAIAALLTLVIPSIHAQDEVRALGVVRTTLTSPSAIATMVASAKTRGFNTLPVQVRGRGDAYFRHGIEPRPAALATQIAAVNQIAGAHPLWAGIGAYRLTAEQIVENTQTARRLGVGGIIPSTSKL